jgi:carboxyl-terminal processing protease
VCGGPNEVLESPYFWERRKKMSKKFLGGLCCGLLVGLLLAGGTGFGVYMLCSQNAKNSQKAISEVLDDSTVNKLSEITSYIRAYYMDEYDVEDLQNSLIAGYVDGLGDKYTVYYTPEEYADLKISTTGTYYGIGAGLQQDPDTMQVTVTKIYKGTPSEDAGLKESDIILYVDDIEATSMELTLLVQKIRGEEGTTVHLQVYRPSTAETLEFDVERKNVVLPSVEGEMLSGNIGYIAIGEWQDNTPEQFKEIVAELEKEGMESLIIDVRSNPGGLLDSVVEVLDYILPKGTVVYTEDKYGQRKTYSSDADCLQYPMAVLINGSSASASEIFAGAIKDYSYGTLIGTTTFGKGIVQSIFTLPDGDALKVTTAKYFTPNGNYIHGVGIDPDIELEYEYSGPTDEAYDMQYDNQLQKAIQILGGK